MSDEKRPYRPDTEGHYTPPPPPPPPIPPHHYQQPPPEPPSYASVPSINSSTPAGPTIGPNGRPSTDDNRNYDLAQTPDYGGPGDQPPPAYTETYGELDITQDGMSTHAQIAEDGRININIHEKSGHLSMLLAPAMRTQLQLAEKAASRARAEKPDASAVFGVPEFARDVPPLNIVIQIIGSRGDVQPFIALGQVLKNQYGHRVRVATHPTFKKFVIENGLEFYSIGGDPAELMAFMVKNPGLMPGMDSLRSGDVSKRRKGMWEILLGGWRACIEQGDGTPEGSGDSAGNRPFIADAIIANPPSFGHVHCAEKLGIPLHLMFTMPWSPTTAFPHPLANIQSSNAESGVTNYLSYVLVDMMTWQGLGDLVNRFRETKLGLDPISTMWAPGMISRLAVPHTYIWSPTLIPKPLDWPSQISISGFSFLSLASSYTPPPDLSAFLAAGPPPVYIGFGSIVVDDPNALTTLLFTALRTLNVRALVSQGWGGLGGADMAPPPNVMLLGNCPHDWLFPRCAAVVHHGGAGTTAAGIRCGKPTVIVPFFGDQPFWGSMVARAGAGPEPVPFKKLTAEILAESIQTALSEEVGMRARELGERIRHEAGAEVGAKTFLAGLANSGGNGGVYRCVLDQSRPAVWRLKKNDAPLSAFAAALLVSNGLVEGGWSGLKFCRHKEWQTEVGPYEPFSGAAGALLGTMGSIMMGVGDFPREIFKVVRKAGDSSPQNGESSAVGGMLGEKGYRSEASLSGSSTPKSMSGPGSTSKSMSGPGSTSEFMSGPSSSQSRGPLGRVASDDSQKSGNNFSMEMAIGAGKGVSRIVEAGLKSPMDFTLGLAQGFHNAPRLYGDNVRETYKVTGFQSGIKAAGKELSLGLYDGISGLVTQPIKGAKEEGAVGLVKGFGKGVGGVFLKGGAAFWGIPGYTMKGIHREIQKLQISDADKQILTSRIAISEAELHQSSLSEQKAALAKWATVRIEPKRPMKDVFNGSFMKGKGKERKKTNESLPYYPHDLPGTPTMAISSPTTEMTTEAAPYTPGVLQQVASYDDDELERAIQQSVRVTSQGNAQHDAAVEAAIRASVAEMQNVARNNPTQTLDEEEEAYQRAIRASMAETSRFNAAGGGGWGGSGGADEWGSYDKKTGVVAADRDLELEEALKQSLVERGGPIMQDEAEFERALRESEMFAEGARGDDEDELQRALRESRRHDKMPQGSTDDRDEDLLKAIEESRRLDEEKEAKRIAEEKIVMDYVIKASLEEQEYGRRRNGGSSFALN